MQYIKEGLIPASLMGNDINISTLGMATMVQDSVVCAFDLFSLGNMDMRKHGLMWVFSKNVICVNKYFGWNNYYKVVSYVSSQSVVTVTADTVFYNKDDEVMFYARTEACALDIASRRIVRTRDIPNMSNAVIYPPMPDISFSRFLIEGDFTFLNKRKILLSSIDYSRHTNNVEYVRFVIDTLPNLEADNGKFSKIEIHFLKESKLGDELSLYKNDDFYLIKNGDLNTTVIKLFPRE